MVTSKVRTRLYPLAVLWAAANIQSDVTCKKLVQALVMSRARQLKLTPAQFVAMERMSTEIGV